MLQIVGQSEYLKTFTCVCFLSETFLVFEMADGVRDIRIMSDAYGRLSDTVMLTVSNNTETCRSASEKNTDVHLDYHWRPRTAKNIVRRILSTLHTPGIIRDLEEDNLM